MWANHVSATYQLCDLGQVREVYVSESTLNLSGVR